MPAAMQVRLLRFRNDGSVQPVGGRAPREADVRIVAATYRDLAAAVAEDSFREDLFYRLKGVVLRTPSLAERATDVPLLARRFLRTADDADERLLRPKTRSPCHDQVVPRQTMHHHDSPD
jgi:two-component system NtrC family response regulator